MEGGTTIQPRSVSKLDRDRRSNGASALSDAAWRVWRFKWLSSALKHYGSLWPSSGTWLAFRAAKTQCLCCLARDETGRCAAVYCDISDSLAGGTDCNQLRWLGMQLTGQRCDRRLVAHNGGRNVPPLLTALEYQERRTNAQVIDVAK